MGPFLSSSRNGPAPRSLAARLHVDLPGEAAVDVTEAKSTRYAVNLSFPEGEPSFGIFPSMVDHDPESQPFIGWVGSLAVAPACAGN